ncbi:hypothetical protein M441DRAFT_32381 [Trichoderma asperellum CBS 433.97]|uniref:HNH nuclease domain-containing protein n=1 Tax=Trichoderma asperellum (strain ATCC 204424 / CBS 433.97 / NBRC 101777) TaxID=1042311 RepID=A0A2T3YQX5_TRIA4|nr:hypothetical protein M441DRAFT_32381 [Trichoderma asperellum CBS 433.97]PTB34924.1 hypothetical protein M441DRAFT_32381 [Trichoderma asperellum CBS 433.97]
MSNASVTPPMRVSGWNIHFLATSAGVRFAGLFRLDGFDITYRDVLTEMRLCFDIPDSISQDGQTNSQDEYEDPWDNLAFAFTDYVNLPAGEASNPPATIMTTDLDQLVPLPPPALPTNVEEPPIIRFRLVRHRSCDLPSTAPWASHFKGGCAHHIPLPTRRRDPRYLPPKMSSTDPRITSLPLRKRAAVQRSSRSPSKRSASGSVSPDKNSESGQLPVHEEESLANMVAPPEMEIAPDFGRQTIAKFRSSLLTFARRCAVSGKGRTWCYSPAIGPAVQACHIVPQQHYHLYPDPLLDPQSDNGLELSPQRLLKAWECTWAFRNGILLLSHLHELFDSRLFSIHPDTLQIRAFVPYDVICDYHGRTAALGAYVDRNALRHHYEMCCIENMAAEMPLRDQLFASETEPTTPSTVSLINTRATYQFISTSIGIREQLHSGDNDQSTRRPSGDPSKRVRAVSIYEEEDGISVLDAPDEAVYEPTQKRRRLEESLGDCGGNISSQSAYDSYIKPTTSEYFLADVNWKLKKFTST